MLPHARVALKAAVVAVAATVMIVAAGLSAAAVPTGSEQTNMHLAPMPVLGSQRQVGVTPLSRSRSQKVLVTLQH